MTGPRRIRDDPTAGVRAAEALSESGLARHELEDLLALPEDFVPVGDKEEGIAFVSQSREVEGRGPGFARDGGGNDEIAAMPVPAFRFEGFERHEMMRLRCDIDQQDLRGELVRRVATEGYKMGDIFPELGTGAVGGQQRRKMPVKFRNPQNPRRPGPESGTL